MNCGHKQYCFFVIIKIIFYYVSYRDVRKPEIVSQVKYSYFIATENTAKCIPAGVVTFFFNAE